MLFYPKACFILPWSISIFTVDRRVAVEKNTLDPVLVELCQFFEIMSQSLLKILLCLKCSHLCPLTYGMEIAHCYLFWFHSSKRFWLFSINLDSSYLIKERWNMQMFILFCPLINTSPNAMIRQKFRNAFIPLQLVDVVGLPNNVLLDRWATYNNCIGQLFNQSCSSNEFRLIQWI